VALYIAAAVAAVLLAAYASWTARRLDRLHARVDAAAAALDEQLAQRAETAARLAQRADLPRAAVTDLAKAAVGVADAVGLGHDRETLENALSRALQDASASLSPNGAETAGIIDVVTRVSFARRFHNDAVRDALAVRRRWVVRLLHLAGHAARPSYFEMDDTALAISDVAAASAPYD
jgi:hypothetical protein